MAGAYYNEIDPHAAQWLRNLIAAGHIAPGDVDERSILDVRADDLRGYTQCHFFAGIGVWSYALRRAGWPDDRPVWTGSCPCQPFSGAGKGLGHEDERHLWPTWFGLIRESRPHVVFGEQVANGDGYAWLDLVGSDVEGIGYALGAVCPAACGVGAPHIRQRLYFVADTSGERRQQVGGGAHSHEGADGRRPAGDHVLSGGGQDGLLAHPACGGSQRARASITGYENGNASSGNIASGCGSGLGVALGDTQHAGLEGHSRDGDHGHKSGRVGTVPAGSASEAVFSGVVVDTEGRGFGVGRDASQQAGGGYPDGSDSGVSLDQAQRVGRGTGGEVDGEDVRIQSDTAVEGGSLGNTERLGGREVLAQWESEGRAPAGRPDAGGAVNGFWAGADWVWCRDPSGPRWRPVEPGTFPLVDGATSRVVKLRAYGNAIVAPVAEEFIRAYIAERGL